MSGWVFFESRKLQSVQTPACQAGHLRCIVEAGMERVAPVLSTMCELVLPRHVRRQVMPAA